MKHLSTLLMLLFCSSYLAHATDPCIGFGAGFTFDIDDATQTTTFINQATGNYGNNIQWSFYDNGNYTYSSDINPVYTPQGDFFVCMDIWSYWCYSSTCKWIVLSDTVPPCQANFEYAANNNNVLGINFTDQSSNYFVTDPQGNQITLDYLWDFGDGQTATDPNPVHDYTSAGIYTVCLYINNPFTNCGDTTCYNVPVNVPTCQANFDYQISYDQSDGIYHADFNNTSYSLVTGATVTYLWDFGDGQSSVQLNPTHVYTSPGQYTACLSIFVQDNAGAIVCTDSTCYNLIISNCNANFDYVVDNNDVNFSDFSTTDTGEITTWLWNFDDGLSSFEQNPTHLYTAPGTYTVCQTITTSWGCTSTWCDDVTVTGCVADFDYTLDVTDGYLATFTNNSTATSGTLSYVWTFGDGTTSTQTNPTHNYANAGTYNVCLTINAFVIGTSIPICTNQVCQTVTIGSCGAAFEYVGGQFANQFVFQDFSFTDLGTVTAWSWDFGDGTTSTEQFPVHDFAPGTYTVCQTITTSWGCTSTWCDDVTVTGCVADFDYTLDVTDGYFANFTNTSTATDGTLSYVWDFGDGTTSTQTNPTHNYANAGTYNVCLTINAFVTGTSIPICTNQSCQTVTVGSCSAAFEYVGGQFANQFVFQDFSFTDLGTVTAWSWDFGDGTTSTEQFPVHDFAVGIYTVCQTITTSWGCTSTWCDDVTVTGCVADFDYTLDVTDGYFANFTNTSTATDGTLSYIWDFGDGTTSTQTNPSHVYTNAGVYNVCLTINAFVIGTSIPICTNQSCQTVTVGSCGAAFEYVGGQFANQYVFQDFSYTDLGTVTSWSWDFGDGTTSTEQFPVHDFAPGTYTVCQTITTSWGCTSTWCDDVTVTGCVADFDFVAAYDQIEGLYYADFTNTSTSTSGTLSYVWDFGDGTTSTQTNPTHNYANAGTYNVCLTINAFVIGTSIPICTNQVCQTVTIGSCGAAFEYVGGQFANQFVFQDFSFTDLGTVTAWSWDFGDGTTSTEQFPVHDFAVGTYNVCLTITTSWGCTSTWCDDITVTGCVADFDFVAGYDQIEGLYYADFTNTSTTTSGTLSYVWTFGDGTTSTQTNPSHVFNNAGIYNVCLTINAFVTGSSIPICTNQSCQTVTVGSCGAAFEYVGGQFANQYVFQDFSFTDLGTVTAWSWDFGDGTTSTEQFPVHDFAVGTYTVCLTITTSWGCTSTWCDNVTVTGCLAGFDYTLDVTDGYFANFTNTSTATDGTLSYIWDFGDGTTSTQTNPSHVYTNAGVYNVCLTVNAFVIGTSIPICTNQVCQTVTIGSCGAAFEYVGGQFANQYVFQDFSFTDLGTVTAWSWDFGDGTTSTEQFPVHDFAVGTYTVCQTITTSWGCTSTWCDNVTVTGCIADFDYALDVTDGYLATFTNNSTATDGTLSYIWDFGDGTTSTQTNPSHVFNNAGIYNVCLTINAFVIGTSIPICTNQSCQTVTVGSCGAAFEYVGGQVANQYVFQDFSFTDLGTVTAWSWDFGDGTTSNEQFPIHDFAVGTYNVCLTITTSWGCTSTWCDDITVTGCVADFDYTLDVSDGYLAIFTNTSTATDGTLSYIWDFGDGTTSTQTNPTHNYANAGVYNVCLTVNVSVFGIPICTNQVCQTITAASCSSYFTAAFDNGIYYFNNLSSTDFGTVTSWAWDFGDGNTSTEQYPDNPYLPGTYYPCLTITTSWGCTATYCDTIIVNACSANFDYSYNYNFATGGLTATFTSTATSSGVIDSYFWDFGDGGTSSAQNPVHDYTSTTGTYNVCLTITSGNCSDTYCQPITLGDCQADFTYTNTDPSTFNFIDLSWSLGGDIIAWNWTFGDGTTSTEQNPQHVYTGVGSYDVCLTFTTAIGCTSTVCQTVTVSLTPICNADFNYQTLANGDLQFNDLSTANSTIVSWAWTFGNQTSSAQNPIQTFVGGFSYDVCLTITTLAGCTDFSCQVVFVPPTCAAFFSNQPTATNPTTIVFTDGSTSNNQITGWLWNFGDNSESEQANPIHTYQQAGTYNVCLTITTANGCNDTYCREIIVGDPCALLSADFTVTGPILFFNPFLKIFTNTSVGDIDNFVWTFGDGTSDNTNLNPTHTYTAFDTYEACLTISNNAGCTNTHCETVVVAPSAPPTINSVTIVPNLLLADGEQIVKVIVESTQAQKCTLTSFAINGQYLKQYEVDLITGENEINLDFTYLSPAVYVVRVEIGNGLPFHEKVFKLK